VPDAERTRFLTLRTRFLALRTRFLTLRTRFLALRRRFLTLRTRFLALRRRFLTLRTRFLTLRTRFLPLRFFDSECLKIRWFYIEGFFDSEFKDSADFQLKIIKIRGVLRLRV
jgi:hypothetical protein